MGGKSKWTQLQIRHCSCAYVATQGPYSTALLALLCSCLVLLFLVCSTLPYPTLPCPKQLYLLLVVLFLLMVLLAKYVTSPLPLLLWCARHDQHGNEETYLGARCACFVLWHQVKWTGIIVERGCCQVGFKELTTPRLVGVLATVGFSS
jgi:hypothetical protein